MALVVAAYLQGELYDGRLHKEVYWGENRRQAADTQIPIVINTGASISITGVKQDLVHKVTPVDPNCKMQGLNDSIRVEGTGIVCWKIQDQLGQIAEIQTTA
jgi:hypothetical protein